MEPEYLKSVMQETETGKELCSLPIKERAAYMNRLIELALDFCREKKMLCGYLP